MTAAIALWNTVLPGTGGRRDPPNRPIIREVEIPFAARYVEESLEEDAHPLASPSLVGEISLLD